MDRMKVSNKKIGNRFEDDFEELVTLNGWRVTRIPDGCRRVSYKGRFKLVPVKSPFDFFATKAPGLSFYCDTKVCDGDTFPYSKINQNQIAELLEHEKNGHIAGYVVYFSSAGYYTFISAGTLSKVVPRASVHHSAAVNLDKEILIDRLFA